MISSVVVGVDGSLGGFLAEALGLGGVKLRHPGESLDAVVPEIADVDVVINVSGPRVRPGLGWPDYLREHVGTATAVARAMRPGAHLVHFSSTAVYGARPGLIDENAPEAPLSFPNPSYAWAKLAGELAARAICGERGVRVSVLRPSMVYGRGVASAIDTMFALGRKGLLVDLTPRATKQHLVHTSVLVRAVERLIARGPVEGHALAVVDPFFFTSGEINDAVARRYRGIKVPVPRVITEAALRRWPLFPAHDAPGALAALACLGMGNEWDARPLFASLAMPADEFSRARTLDPYLEDPS